MGDLGAAYQVFRMLSLYYRAYRTTDRASASYERNANISSKSVEALARAAEPASKGYTF